MTFLQAVVLEYFCVNGHKSKPLYLVIIYVSQKQNISIWCVIKQIIQNGNFLLKKTVIFCIYLKVSHYEGRFLYT